MVQPPPATGGQARAKARQKLGARARPARPKGRPWRRVCRRFTRASPGAAYRPARDVNSPVSTLRWIALAAAGIAVAAGVSVAASRLAQQPIGLSSEPLSVARGLAPPPLPGIRGGRPPRPSRPQPATYGRPRASRSAAAAPAMTSAASAAQAPRRSMPSVGHGFSAAPRVRRLPAPAGPAPVTAAPGHQSQPARSTAQASDGDGADDRHEASDD